MLLFTVCPIHYFGGKFWNKCSSSMHVALLKHGMDYSSWQYDWNVDYFYWFDVNKRLNRWHLDSNLCTRTSQFYVHVLHWNCAYWNFKPHLRDKYSMDFDSKETIRSSWLFRKWWVQIFVTITSLCYHFKPNCGTKNIKYIKMASKRNTQNSSPHDLKRTNCTINVPLVFTILVYVISGESLKVFFVTKFRVFYIYVSQNSM